MKKEEMYLEMLQNAANTFGGKVHVKKQDDKRKTKPVFFCNVGNETVSPNLKFDEMNAFLLGYIRAHQKHNKKVDSFEELKRSVNVARGFVEVTEDLYFEALTAVPPNYLKNGTWQMGEEYSNGLFYTFGQKGGKYFGCLCNANFAINNF